MPLVQPPSASLLRAADAVFSQCLAILREAPVAAAACLAVLAHSHDVNGTAETGGGCAAGQQECGDGSCVDGVCGGCALGFRCGDGSCVLSSKLCANRDDRAGNSLVKCLLLLCAFIFLVLSGFLCFRKREKIRQAMLNRMNAERTEREREALRLTTLNDPNTSDVPTTTIVEPPPYADLSPPPYSALLSEPPPTYEEACAAQTMRTTDV